MQYCRIVMNSQFFISPTKHLCAFILCSRHWETLKQNSTCLCNRERSQFPFSLRKLLHYLIRHICNFFILPPDENEPCINQPQQAVNNVWFEVRKTTITTSFGEICHWTFLSKMSHLFCTKINFYTLFQVNRNYSFLPCIV